MHEYYTPGTGCISVGSSIRRDLRYDMAIHCLSPVLMSSDADRTDLMVNHFTKVPGQGYYRCNGGCANTMLTYCPDVDRVSCAKHTACFHMLKECNCIINGSRVTRSSSFYMFTHSAYYIPIEDMHEVMPAGSIAVAIVHDIPRGKHLTVD